MAMIGLSKNGYKHIVENVVNTLEGNINDEQCDKNVKEILDNEEIAIGNIVKIVKNINDPENANLDDAKFIDKTGKVIDKFDFIDGFLIEMECGAQILASIDEIVKIK